MDSFVVNRKTFQPVITETITTTTECKFHLFKERQRGRSRAFVTLLKMKLLIC